MRIWIIKNIGIAILGILLFACQDKSKELTLVKIAKLPSSLHEISGMVLLSDYHLYAINDSGNDNSVFKLNLDGQIIDQIKIPNSTNMDWEDLAYDQEDNLYIGDFGNNKYNRKDLVIYKVSNILQRKPKVIATRFTYENKESHNVESFIILDKHFYLFTKNRGVHHQYTTKVYRIPAIEGRQEATLIKTLSICDSSSNCRITGATINKKKDKLALLTKNLVFLFKRDHKGTNFFNSSPTKIDLKHTSQKESICFFNENQLLIADEKSNHQKAKLYSVQLKN